MARTTIFFYTEDITFSLNQKTHLRNWISQTIRNEGKHLGELSFIFCSDEYLLGINQQYLNHDTYTDIITFDNSSDDSLIAGDIFISVERIRENASKFKTELKDELHRVMIHGILHLLGYKDKNSKDKAQMTEKEDQYLRLRSF